jgi:SAM-dependent methyltransferase
LPLPDVYRLKAEATGYQYFGRGETIALDTYTCPHCGASDRERLYALWLNREMSLSSFNKNSSLLHVAPEASLSEYIKNTGYFKYESADMMMPNVDHQVDLTNLPFDDNTYDLFICSHVLEHVDDDHKAIAELFRVTKKGGRGILMAPICQDIEFIHENPAITDPDERWANFGQDDHVRLYSHDGYVQRIKEAGFKVEQLTIKEFGKKDFKRLGLSLTSRLYIVTKQ